MILEVLYTFLKTWGAHPFRYLKSFWLGAMSQDNALYCKEKEFCNARKSCYVIANLNSCTVTCQNVHVDLLDELFLHTCNNLTNRRRWQCRWVLGSSIWVALQSKQRLSLWEYHVTNQLRGSRLCAPCVHCDHDLLNICNLKHTVIWRYKKFLSFHSLLGNTCVWKKYRWQHAILWVLQIGWIAHSCSVRSNATHWRFLEHSEKKL